MAQAARTSATSSSWIVFREAAVRLNPTIPAQGRLRDALEKLLDRRQAMTLVAANQEVYNLLRDGIPWSLMMPRARSRKSACA